MAPTVIRHSTATEQFLIQCVLNRKPGNGFAVIPGATRLVPRLSLPMSAFQNAQNFVLSNPVFTDQSNHYQYKVTGIDVLREASAPEAAFDSDSRRYAPSCFPGTRLQYIEDIVNWATAQSAFPMYRMTGPAGVGKSAIAQTCAEELRSRYLLGASFFFTMHRCSDYSRLFPSISYQLSSKSPDYHELLDKKLQLDPTLVRKQLRSQFRELIVEPLRELEQRGRPFARVVILIDGLDECKDKDAQREIIEIVISSVGTCSTPFYWGFFSRPEPQIEAAFADHRVVSLCVSTFLPVSRGIDGEINLYIRSGLQNILRRRGITTSVPWPSEKDMCSLVSMAKGLYIYATTVLRFVGRTDTPYDPPELLRMVMKASLQCSDGGSTRSPFGELDAFYTLILQRVPNELRCPTQLFLSLMVFDHMTGEKQAAIGIRAVSNALGITETKTKMLCSELVAVVHRTRANGVPVASQGQSLPDTNLYHRHLTTTALIPPIKEVYAREEWLEFYHKSFFDFLCDPSRSGQFCVTTVAMRNQLFQHLVEFQINYSRFYSFQSSSGLTLAADKPSNVADEHHGLSWPSDSKLLNPTIRALLFERVGAILFENFFPYDDLDNQLLRRLAHIDHRLTFGFGCIMKRVRGTMLYSTAHRDMLSFDPAKFRKGILRLEAAQVIQRYQPSSTILELPLFRCDSDGNASSGLYIKGQGEMSTFWYWFLDTEMGYYRDFEATDFSEGERIFREEEFELWPHEEDEGEDEGGWSSSSLSKSEPSDDEVQWYST